MKQQTLNRYDLSDRAWNIIQPYLPGRRDLKSRPAKNNRLFINVVIWILRTGAPLRDLPPEYGNWSNQDPDFEWLMIDASYTRYIHMERNPEEAIRTWDAQKGA